MITNPGVGKRLALQERRPVAIPRIRIFRRVMMELFVGMDVSRENRALCALSEHGDVLK